MDVSYLKKNIESLSEEVHNAWMTQKISQGYHSPSQCPIHDSSDDQRGISGKFTRHCGKCHTDIYEYAELPENVKEYDRVTVLAVISAIEKL